MTIDLMQKVSLWILLHFKFGGALSYSFQFLPGVRHTGVCSIGLSTVVQNICSGTRLSGIHTMLREVSFMDCQSLGVNIILTQNGWVGTVGIHLLPLVSFPYTWIHFVA